MTTSGKLHHRHASKTGIPKGGQPESQPESRPESRPELRPESRPESGPESGPESRPESGPESRPESGLESMGMPILRLLENVTLVKAEISDELEYRKISRGTQ